MHPTPLENERFDINWDLLCHMNHYKWAIEEDSDVLLFDASLFQYIWFVSDIFDGAHPFAPSARISRNWADDLVVGMARLVPFESYLQCHELIENGIPLIEALKTTHCVNQL